MTRNLNPEQIKKLFSQINVWKRGSERAPHKPLLLLYALAKCSRGAEPHITYREVDTELRKLLVEFGPSVGLIIPNTRFGVFKMTAFGNLTGLMA